MLGVEYPDGQGASGCSRKPVRPAFHASGNGKVLARVHVRGNGRVGRMQLGVAIRAVGMPLSLDQVLNRIGIDGQ